MSSSLLSRYLYKLGGNVFALIFSLISVAMITRSLGAHDFGKFEFLTSGMINVYGLFTSGLLIAYSTWVSRDETDDRLKVATSWAVVYFSIIFMLVSASIACIYLMGYSENVFIDTQGIHVFFAALLQLINIFLDIVTRLADSRALTVGSEKRKMLQGLVKMLVLGLLYAFERLNITWLFLVNLSAALYSVISLSLFLSSKCQRFFSLPALFDMKASREFLLFVYSFIKPMILLTVMGSIAGYVEKWLLQYDGPNEFGAYSFAYKLATLPSIFLAAATPIFFRELSFSVSRNDIAEARRIFLKTRDFMMLATFFSVIFAFNSDFLLIAIGGKTFHDAGLILAILAFFPIHQVLGQCCQNVIYAKGLLKRYTQLASAALLLGTLVSILVLSRPDAAIPGLGLGALGMAIKVVSLNILSNQVYLLLATRTMEVPYIYWIKVQASQLFFFGVIGATSWYISKLIVSGNVQLQWFYVNRDILSSGLRGAVFGVTYLSLTLMAIQYFPRYFGFRSNPLQVFSSKVSQYLGRKAQE